MHFKEILKILCKSDPALLKSNGNINQNAVERATGVNQTTIKRMIDGDSLQPKDANIRKIADFFSITMPQARGDVPLPDRFYLYRKKKFNDTGFKLNQVKDQAFENNELTSGIQHIYQTLLECSDKIDRKSAEDIVDFIHYKAFQMENKI